MSSGVSSRHKNHRVFKKKSVNIFPSLNFSHHLLSFAAVEYEFWFIFSLLVWLFSHFLCLARDLRREDTIQHLTLWSFAIALMTVPCSSGYGFRKSFKGTRKKGKGKRAILVWTVTTPLAPLMQQAKQPGVQQAHLLVCPFLWSQGILNWSVHKGKWVMMLLWKLEMRPYGLSWPIYKTCDKCDCSRESEGMKITAGGQPTKSKSPYERSTSHTLAVPTGWASCILHLCPANNDWPVIMSEVLLWDCYDEAQKVKSPTSPLLPASFCFRKLFLRSQFCSCRWAQDVHLLFLIRAPVQAFLKTRCTSCSKPKTWSGTGKPRHEVKHTVAVFTKLVTKLPV